MTGDHLARLDIFLDALHHYAHALQEDDDEQLALAREWVGILSTDYCRTPEPEHYTAAIRHRLRLITATCTALDTRNPARTGIGAFAQQETGSDTSAGSGLSNSLRPVVRLRPPELPPGVRAVMRDFCGRQVVLTETTWDHILEGHIALDGHEEALKTAVERADVVHRGKGAGVECLCGKALGPARWLVVVVAYGPDGTGRIKTAYPKNRDPQPDPPER